MRASPTRRWLIRNGVFCDAPDGFGLRYDVRLHEHRRLSNRWRRAIPQNNTAKPVSTARTFGRFSSVRPTLRIQVDIDTVVVGSCKRAAFPGLLPTPKYLAQSRKRRVLFALCTQSVLCTLGSTAWDVLCIPISSHSHPASRCHARLGYSSKTGIAVQGSELAARPASSSISPRSAYCVEREPRSPHLTALDHLPIR